MVLLLQHGRHSWALPALLIWGKSSTWSNYWRPGTVMEYLLSESYCYSKMSIDMSSILYQANWGDEYVRLKSKLDALQKSQRYRKLAQVDPYSGYDNVYWLWLIVSVYSNGRHLLGEQLDSLTIKELQQLEQQLDSSLKHIRSRKVNKLGLKFLFGGQLIWLFTNI